MLHPGEMGIKGDEVRRTGSGLSGPQPAYEVARCGARASRVGESDHGDEDPPGTPRISRARLTTVVPFCGSHKPQ